MCFGLIILPIPDLSASPYLPFNPFDSAKKGDVNRIERSARWKQGQVGPGHYGYIVYKTDANSIWVATEQLAKGKGHFFEKKKFPKGRISVRQYLKQVWSIQVPASIPIQVSNSPHCWVKLRWKWKHKGGGSQYFPHLAFGDRFFGLFEKDDSRSPRIKNCTHIEFGGTANNFKNLNAASDKLAVYSIMLHPKVAVHGTYRLVIRFFDKTDFNWFEMGVSYIKHQQTDRALWRTNMKKYYSTFRHTKLYKYAYETEPSTTISTTKLRKGQRVLGLYQKWWYPAHISSISGSKASVLWYDKTQSTLNIGSQIRKYNWTPGKSILCKTPWKKEEWKWGEIRSASGDQIRIQFTGTDLPVRVPVGDCSDQG